MAITYAINNFNSTANPPITYPFNSCILTVMGDGSSTTLIVPLSQYPFYVPLDKKNAPTSVAVTASSTLSSFSFNAATMEVTAVWPSASAVHDALSITLVYGS